jgi:spermidine synthase
VLVLGLAAGTQARAMRHFHGEGAGVRVDGVELDPAAVRAGRAWFDLGPEEPWLRVHEGDARAFLEAAPSDRLWDLILVDCYGHEYYVPFHVATEEFFARVRAHLRPGGVAAFNAFAYRPDDALLRAIENTAATAFGRVWRAAVPGYPNYVVLATRREGEVDLPLLHLARHLEAAGAGKGTPPAAIAAFAARPESGPVMRLAAQVLGSARAVAPDPEGVVLTDDRAPVERLTDRAIRDYEAARAGRRP